MRKKAMPVGKEMQFALDRFSRLRRQVAEAKKQGFVDPNLVRERNDALAEAIALIRQVEAHLSGEYKERLHKLHQHLEKWQAEAGAQ